MGAKKVIHVCGWMGCPWYQRAAKLAASMQLMYPTKFESEVHESKDRDGFVAELETYRKAVTAERAMKHKSSPFVYVGDGGSTSFVGGCDDTIAWAKAELAEQTTGLAPAADESKCEMVPDGFTKDHGYDYDVVVIGGGSGGLATSKECAKLGAKTACLDFVKPSPAGSTWGLGGTCVNVGCIPKKLMHTASIVGDVMKEDAAGFGWSLSTVGAHDWESMRSSVQNYIKSLNFQYRVALRDAKVTYLNALGEFKGDHEIEVTDREGAKKTITAARFVVAVGGRPTALSCEGGDLAIDSDDLFSLEKAPGKTLCVGGGYVSLECGGFLGGLGYETTCMVRSVVLRGFDRECVDKIAGAMGHHGVRMAVGVVPAKIVKLADGRLEVTDSKGGVEVYDTVLAAVGRTADCAQLGVGSIKGASESVNPKTLKFKCVNEQLPTAPHVYAIGDVVDGCPELTPVAIEAGLRLARRLFGSSKERMDYENVATTVFTPLEYGAIGMTEEEATADLGADGVEVYVSEFAPLEHALSEAKQDRGAPCLAKLVVDKSNDRVVGFHYLGPNAGEVTQGFSVAMRKKATYEDFAKTVGIHPTIAEEFTTISVTKSSGVSAAKGGC